MIFRGEQMKKQYLILSFLLVMVMPWALLSLFPVEGIERPENSQTQPTSQSEEITFRLETENGVTTIGLEEYILGVVLGEMPADFEFEALKAQAVAARTYTVKRLLGGKKHANVSLCTDPACCQAYISTDYYGGTDSDLSKVRQAVAETAGEIITYNGTVIEATYFSSSGGKTEDAISVWGSDVPYLISVNSPEKESHEKVYSMPVDTFCEKLGIAYRDNITVKLTFTDGYGVETMTVDEHIFTGVQARKLLQLSSTFFTVTVHGQSIEIISKGNGHRVGMSQYGADAMAVEGKDYKQILSHYYRGTKLETCEQLHLNAVFDKV